MATTLPDWPGWEAHPVSLYDEEGVEGWRWEGPDGEEIFVIGPWHEQPPAPDTEEEAV